MNANRTAIASNFFRQNIVQAGCALSTAAHHSSSYFIDLEDRFGSHNYHPIPVVLSRGEGEAAA